MLPRQAAEPDRKFQLTDMPTSITAALVTRLADRPHLVALVRSGYVGSFDERAVLEFGSGLRGHGFPRAACH